MSVNQGANFSIVTASFVTQPNKFLLNVYVRQIVIKHPVNFAFFEGFRHFCNNAQKSTTKFYNKERERPCEALKGLDYNADGGISMKAIDIAGQRFGRLVALEPCRSPEWQRRRWKCICDCGNIHYAETSSLRGGSCKSCGCQNDDIRKSGINRRMHGGAGTRLYRIWKLMKSRCYNEHSQDFHDYGEKGITVCDEWRNDFPAFREWAASNGYADNLSIDRIDVTKGYSPKNCRWADNSTQANNKRNTIIVEINGITRPITEWAKIAGLSRQTVYLRYYNGQRGEELLAPLKKQKKVGGDNKGSQWIR